MEDGKARWDVAIYTVIVQLIREAKQYASYRQRWGTGGVPLWGTRT